MNRINTTCPSCKQQLTFQYDHTWTEASGRWVECNICNKRFVITYQWKLTEISIIEGSLNNQSQTPDSLPKGELNVN